MFRVITAAILGVLLLAASALADTAIKASAAGISDGGMTSGTLPKYNGTSLVDSLLDDDGTNVRLTSGDIILGVDGTSQLRSYSGGSTYGAAAIRFNANYSETEFYFNGTKRAVINMGQAFLTDSVNIGATPANANQITMRRISTGRLELGTYTAGQMSVSITTGVVAGSGITKATNYEELDIIADNAGTISLEAKSAGTGSDNIDIDLIPAGTGGVALANGGEGGTGNIYWFYARQVHTLAGATESTTTLAPAIASGDIVYGCLATVNTAVTNGGDDTWHADWDASLNTTAMEQGVAAAQNTKSNFLIAPLRASGVAQVVFTPQAGSFTAGVIEVMCLVQSTTSMANA